MTESHSLKIEVCKMKFILKSKKVLTSFGTEFNIGGVWISAFTNLTSSLTHKCFINNTL